MSFEPNRLTSYTNDSILDEIKRVVTKRFDGRIPKQTEFDKVSRVHSATVRDYFGSWENGIKAAGFDYARSSSTGKPIVPISTEEILRDELRKIRKKLGGDILDYKEYQRLGGAYSKMSFQNHFGSWSKALAEHGLRNGHSRPREGINRKYTDNDYFDEMQRVWEKLGRQPKNREMRNHGKISDGAFRKRFKSWMKAVHAFCLDRGISEDSSIAGIITEKSAQNEILSTEKPKEQTLPSMPHEEQILIKRTPRVPSLRLRFYVFNRDHFTCKSCGKSPAKELNVELQIDHIKPYSKGGETVAENLQTLCKVCNLGRSNLYT